MESLERINPWSFVVAQRSSPEMISGGCGVPDGLNQSWPALTSPEPSERRQWRLSRRRRRRRRRRWVG